MKLILLLAIALGCEAQTPKLPVPVLPDWIGGGAGFGPHWSSWAALSMPLSPSQGIYSYSEYESVIKRGIVPATNTKTGLAPLLRSYPTRYGTLYLFGLATAGAAVSATATTLAASGGGLAVFKFKNGWTIEGTLTEETSAGRAYKVGWGKTFGGQ